MINVSAWLRLHSRGVCIKKVGCLLFANHSSNIISSAGVSAPIVGTTSLENLADLIGNSFIYLQMLEFQRSNVRNRCYQRCTDPRTNGLSRRAVSGKIILRAFIERTRYIAKEIDDKSPRRQKKSMYTAATNQNNLNGRVLSERRANAFQEE